jgi:predicted GH43/DUF377 family glycosyl hydrolase
MFFNCSSSLKRLFLFISFIFFECYLGALIDLDEEISDFILETQKIEIEGYPTAFNPALVRWKGNYLMSFRIRDLLTASTDQIGFIWLNEDFKPMTKPSILSIEFETAFFPPMTQDPRLVNVGEDLYIVFNDMIKIGRGSIRRMYVGKVQQEEDDFYVENPQVLLNFGESQNLRHEKNWVPFEYENCLLLSQSINPHHVSYVASEANACHTVAYSSASIDWQWGELRGGTPALKDGNEYIAFFHSSRDIQTVQANEKKLTHYVMGAYTFNAAPPFNLTKISPAPIVAKTFYQEPYHQTWKPLRVVFPVGVVCDDKHIWVSYGRQDHEAWIIKFDKEGLYKSLVSLINQPLINSITIPTHNVDLSYAEEPAIYQ